MNKSIENITVRSLEIYKKKKQLNTYLEILIKL